MNFPEIPKWSWKWTLASCLVNSLLYLSFAFRGWNNLRDLVDLTLPFMTLAFAIGVFFSGLPIRRRLLTTFFAAAPAPMGAYFIALLTSQMIAVAQAGTWGTGETIPLSDPQYLYGHVWFFAGLGLTFGVVASFGCFLGILLQHGARSLFEVFAAKHDAGTTTDERVAMIGAKATILAGIVGVAGSVLIAFMG